MAIQTAANASIQQIIPSGRRRQSKDLARRRAALGRRNRREAAGSRHPSVHLTPRWDVAPGTVQRRANYSTAQGQPGAKNSASRASSVSCSVSGDGVGRCRRPSARLGNPVPPTPRTAGARSAASSAAGMNIVRTILSNERLVRERAAAAAGTSAGRPPSGPWASGGRPRAEAPARAGRRHEAAAGWTARRSRGCPAPACSRVGDLALQHDRRVHDPADSPVRAEQREQDRRRDVVGKVAGDAERSPAASEREVEVEEVSRHERRRSTEARPQHRDQIAGRARWP